MHFSRGPAVLVSLLAIALCIGCSDGGGAGGDTRGDPSDPIPPSRPQIAKVFPSEAKVGEVVTISGSGFKPDGAARRAALAEDSLTVTIGGFPAPTIETWTDTEITARVPEGALTGDVTVSVGGGQSEAARIVVLWGAENPENAQLSLCADPGNDWAPMNTVMIPDGSGGVIVAWEDFRGYGVDDSGEASGAVRVFAQRLDSSGKPLWAANGIEVSRSPGTNQFFPQLVSDGAGGAIFVWEDYPGGFDTNVCAQHVGASGEVLWSADTAVSAEPGTQEKPRIASDGAGGAILVWQDSRSSSRYDVYAQRIDGGGAALWAPGGVAVSTAADDAWLREFSFPRVSPDGSGGALIAWQETRSGTRSLRAQRMDGAGTARWAQDGVLVSAAPVNYQYVPDPVPDGQGGALLAWEADCGETGVDVRAQRIGADGARLWGSDDRVVSAAVGDQRYLETASDTAGGAILVWQDGRGGSASPDVYAQRIDGDGVALWQTDGVALSSAASAQYEPKIAPDGSGGAIVTWYDYRNYDAPYPGVAFEGVDVYAQRVDAAGVPQWTADGEPISTAGLHQMYPVVAADGNGGAVIVWEDQRTGQHVELYAQGVSFGGRQ